VGIGTTSPGETLNVVGGGSTTSTLNVTGGNNNDNATIASDYNLVFQVDANNNIGGRTYDWRYGGKGYSDGTLLMRLDASGNVGIGVTSPSSKLVVSYGGYTNAGFALDIGADIGNNTSRTNATDKLGMMVVPHRTNAEEPLAVLYGYSYTAGSDVVIGGGVTAANAATQILFYTAANTTTVVGTERMRIDASGNVGIGTTNPETSRLLVRGSTSDSTSNIIQASNSAGATRFIVRADGQTIFYGSDNGEKVRITETGNVGIGTTGPSLKLQVVGTDGAPASSGTAQTGIMRLSGDNNAVVDFGKYSASPYGGWIQVTDKTDLGYYQYPLVLQPNGGNVGIGTTSPGVKLEVAGEFRVAVDADSVVNIINAGTDAIAMYGAAGDDLYLGGNNTQQLRLKSTGVDVTGILTTTGNVGIGTTSPRSRLEINGTQRMLTTTLSVNINSSASVDITQALLGSDTGVILGSMLVLVGGYGNSISGNITGMFMVSGYLFFDNSGTSTITTIVNNVSDSGSMTLTRVGTVYRLTVTNTNQNVGFSKYVTVSVILNA
jgi:hypothetical protein